MSSRPDGFFRDVLSNALLSFYLLGKSNIPARADLRILKKYLWYEWEDTGPYTRYLTLFENPDSIIGLYLKRESQVEGWWFAAFVFDVIGYVFDGEMRIRG